ncbi:MAG: hypothetical protein JWO94_3103 [Verrucomicrobiaceae bacterium]|nr:hypothetical protein [Verrucomicrobiaceae bacterium]
MRSFLALALLLTASGLSAADAPAVPASAAPAKPVLKINPGQVIVPIDAMRRIWGELVSLDAATRTGTFRKEGTDEILSFTVLPYAELLHHAAFGDLQDFRISERAIFRLHEAADGQWTWLTYIQDQMNMMNGHKEYFYVDAIDSAAGKLTCTQANFDKSFVREKGILIETDAATRYWKNARPAAFADIHVGDKIRTQTHGIGKGKVQMCWEVFLDDESLLKFQSTQKAVHARRMAEEGLPGYVDKSDDSASGGTPIHLTLFQEGGETARTLKPGQKVRLAPAGIDRKPTAAPVNGTVTEAKMAGNLGKVTVTLDAPATGFQPGVVARLWVGQ